MFSYFHFVLLLSSLLVNDEMKYIYIYMYIYISQFTLEGSINKQYTY